MKKTLSFIYRPAFIMLSLWAIFENAGFNFGGLLPQMANFTVFSNALFLIIICTVFIISLKKQPSVGILKFKSFCTVLACLIIALNFHAVKYGLNISLILKIVLPLMFFADWLFFDKKGGFGLNILPVWLACIAALIFAFLYALKNIFHVVDFSDISGLGTFFSDPFAIVPYLLLSGFVPYLCDRLLSDKGRKSASNLFRLIFRLIFVLIELFSFYLLSNMNITGFILSLKNYPLLVNFLCFLIMCVLLIFDIFASGKNANTLLFRIKGAFTLAIIGAALIQFAVFKTYDLHLLNTVTLIHTVIAPIMMVLDMIFFDVKKAYKVYDPLWWLVLPVGYFVLNRYVEIFSYMPSWAAIGIGSGILLLIGYAFFLFSKLR